MIFMVRGFGGERIVTSMVSIRDTKVFFSLSLFCDMV